MLVWVGLMSSKTQRLKFSFYSVWIALTLTSLTQVTNIHAGTGSCPASGSNSITTPQTFACELADGDSLTVETEGSIIHNGGNAVSANSVTNIGAITNNGEISATGDAGDDNAINVDDSQLTGGIVNSGTIRSSEDDGISIYGGSTLTGDIVNNLGATIKSESPDAGSLDSGIEIDAATVTGNIINYGTISSSGDGGGVTIWGNNNAGETGILGGAIINYGTISGTNPEGLDIDDGATVSQGIKNYGTISSVETDAIEVDEESVVNGGIVNSDTGVISSDGASAIEIDEDAVVNGGIVNSGEISSDGADAIEIMLRAVVNDGIVNTGLIRSTDNDTIEISDGAKLYGGISNTGSGEISTTAGDTIYITDAGSTLAGGLNNTSTMSSTDDDVVDIANADSSLSGTIDNSGTMTAEDNVIENEGTIEAINNSGRMEAGDTGIYLDSGSTLGSLVNSGTIKGTNNALFIDANATVSNDIINTGVLDGSVVLGGSTLNLNGDSAGVSGAVTGDPGSKVYVNGTFSSENTFSVGHFEITNGGVFDMAHDVTISNVTTFLNKGVLSVAAGDRVTIVNGPYVQDAAGVLRIGISNATTYGQLEVQGTATLPSNAKIDVTFSNFDFNTNQFDDVLSATTLNSDGSFAVTEDSGLFDVIALKDGNTVDLQITTATDNTISGPGANAYNDVLLQLAGQYVAKGTTGNADMDLVIEVLGRSSDAEIQAGVEQTLPLLTGSATPAIGNALSGTNRVVQARMASNRGLSSGDPSLMDKHSWVKVYGSWFDQDDQGGVSGYDGESKGLVAGMDGDLNDRTKLGFAFAYNRTDIDSNSLVAPNSVDIDTYQLVTYGSYVLANEAEISFQADVGTSDADGARTIIFMNPRRVALSNDDSINYHLGFGLGKTFAYGSNSQLAPSVRLDYTRIDSDGYTETGAGALNLRVEDKTYEALDLGADLKLNHQVNEKILFSANMGVAYDLIDQDSSITAAYIGGGGTFVTYGIDNGPWIGRASLGVTTQLIDGAEMTARYDFEARNDFDNQTASVKLRWAF